jgi:chitodextrinase
MKIRKPASNFAFALKTRVRAAVLLIAMLCCAGGAWAQQALPYEYGFENPNLAADGWIANITNSSSGIKPEAAHSDTYGFRFYYSEQTGSLISPLLTGSEYGLEVSFWYKEDSNQYGDEQFQVGYTTDEAVTDADAFTYGEVITASTDWQQYQNTFPAGTKRIAIKYIYGDHFYLFLDDFVFDAVSLYPKPTALTVSDLTTTDATISWTAPAGSPTGYAYQYKKVSEENWSAEVSVTATSVTLSGLEAGTSYDFHVKAVYGSDGESAFATIHFTVPLCMGGRVIEYSLTDSYGDGWGDNAINVLDGCGNVVETLTIAEGASKSGVLFLCEDAYQFVWHNGIYPGECSFTFTENSTTIITRPNELNDGDVLYTIGTIYPIPTDLTAGNPGKNSVVLNWAADGSETAWEICINGDEANVMIASTNVNYELSGLEPETEYTVKVRACFDATTYSCWSKVITFTTLTPITLSDAADNSTTLAACDGKELEVTLLRTLQAGGYNTFAAPFAISSADLSSLGITAKKLTSSSLADNTLTLIFANADEIEAGKPYLVKVDDNLNLGGIAFDGVIVSKETVNTETDAVDFIPTLGATAIETDDVSKILFLGTDNTLYHPDSTPSMIQGFRAYFQLKEAAEVENFVLDFGDGDIATGIFSMDNGQWTIDNDATYDLQGRRIESKPTQRGIYIKNDKKVLIK